MDLYKTLQEELRSEYETTKKFLARFPEDKLDYSPHEKSMNMKELVNHVVEIFAWPKSIMDTPYLDFAKGGYVPSNVESKEGLLKKLDEDFKTGRQGIAQLNEENIDDSWDIRQGDQVMNKWTKYGAIRHSLNQIAHHRAQLGVFYRLNDVYVPGSYGPSADDQAHM